MVTQLEAIDDGDLRTAGVRDRVDRAEDLARQSLGEARRAVDAPHTPALDAVLRAAAGHSVLAQNAVQSLMDRGRVESLTDREVEVLQAVARGGTNRDVAKDLQVSEATVKTHLLRLYPKLGVRDRAAAVRVAFERGLIG